MGVGLYAKYVSNCMPNTCLLLCFDIVDWVIRRIHSL